MGVRQEEPCGAPVFHEVTGDNGVAAVAPVGEEEAAGDGACAAGVENVDGLG